MFGMFKRKKKVFNGSISELKELYSDMESNYNYVVMHSIELYELYGSEIERDMSDLKDQIRSMENGVSLS